MEVKLISVTENPEKTIAYIARVSNPENQANPDYGKLIKYLLRNGHFSPFEHAFMTFEITTSMAIGEQLLRHRSFTFQKFSGRYSQFTEFEPIELRKQAIKNRQSSLEAFNPIVYDTEIPIYAGDLITTFMYEAKHLYEKLIGLGVAKEQARFVLPAATQTTMYMTGSIRSWIHYIELRDTDHVQKEHRLITQQIRGIFNQYLPTVAEALAQLQKEKEDKEFLYSLLNAGHIKIGQGTETGTVIVQEGIYETRNR
jgi:thymidylate synthase (FAD)